MFLAAAGCGEATRENVGAAPTPSLGVLTEWPDVQTSNADCVVDYPRDLRERSVAFDGTIEKVQLGEYDEDAGATPARVEIRVHEVFYGDIEGFIVMRTWDFMLPDDDLSGKRVLVAADHSLDLMGCGFTRPYSKEDADFWRKTFSEVPPEDCGTAVRDCDLDGLGPVPADCSHEALEYSIYSNIDAGGFPFKMLRCNAKYLSLRVDLGAGACLPEASKEERKECARMKTAYFVGKGDRWKLLTYEEKTRCQRVQTLDPSFPTEFCRP